MQQFSSVEGIKRTTVVRKSSSRPRWCRQAWTRPLARAHRHNSFEVNVISEDKQQRPPAPFGAWGSIGGLRQINNSLRRREKKKKKRQSERSFVTSGTSAAQHLSPASTTCLCQMAKGMQRSQPAV